MREGICGKRCVVFYSFHRLPPASRVSLRQGAVVLRSFITLSWDPTDGSRYLPCRVIHWQLDVLHWWASVSRSWITMDFLPPGESDFSLNGPSVQLPLLHFECMKWRPLWFMSPRVEVSPYCPHSSAVELSSIQQIGVFNMQSKMQLLYEKVLLSWCSCVAAMIAPPSGQKNVQALQTLGPGVSKVFCRFWMFPSSYTPWYKWLSDERTC